MPRDERHRRYARKQSAAAADIGALPEIVDPERRARCEGDLELFLTTYFPHSTGLKPFSDDHRRVINRIQRCVLEGGLFAQAVYRGFGKTTISENSVLWAILYAHRQFVVDFGADAVAAKGIIDSLKLELSENDLLYEDFPEICHPIRALEGKPQRCASQTFEGRLTHIGWTADMIVLPDIPGSKAAGSIITCKGITAASRGLKHKRADGVQMRPDFVVIDDPQTDESASTALQVNKRLDVIRKNILKLGGHNRKIACVMNATVIKPDDLIEKLLDPRKFSAWQGERIKLVRRWSDAHDKLWMEDYARIRTTYAPDILGDQQRAHRDATRFYLDNRDAMDAGCEVSWEHCYDEEVETSAIQHAYNSLIDDGPDVFASECQNEPLVEKVDGVTPLDASTIMDRACEAAAGQVPLEASAVVAFIDVQQNLLYWMITAVGDGFTSRIVDYGTWPDQKRKYFSAASARKTTQKVTGKASLGESTYAALDRLVGELSAREFVRDDGAAMRVERMMIDANWGQVTDTIYQFCRQSPQSAMLIPSHGKYVGATSRPFAEWRPKPGDKLGPGWRMPALSSRRQTRYLLFDANYWKTCARERLATDPGGRGAVTIFGEPEQHRMLADQLLSEEGIRVEAKGRSVIEWKIKPGRPDNHLLDCFVGCLVVASVQGISFVKTEKNQRIKRIKLSELQKHKRHFVAGRDRQ